MSTKYNEVKNDVRKLKKELEIERRWKAYSDNGSEGQEMGVDDSTHDAADEETVWISVFAVK